MMWVNKHDPRAVYFDKRDEDFPIEPNAAYPNGTTLKVRPDVCGDFTDLPFPDDSFRLVVMDPPHFTKIGTTGVLGKTYGKLFPGWEDVLSAGFRECFRVLKSEGVLIFKWCSFEIPLTKVLALSPHPPLFGHNTGNRAKTHWMTFMKPNGPICGNNASGSRIFEPYAGIPCTCTEKCPDPCKGKCGCNACRTAYQDFLSNE